MEWLTAAINCMRLYTLFSDDKFHPDILRGSRSGGLKQEQGGKIRGNVTLATPLLKKNIGVMSILSLKIAYQI